MKRRVRTGYRLAARPLVRRRPRRDSERRLTGYPLLVHPVPTSRQHILAIVNHLARQCAATLGKPPPTFSEPAAAFLSGRRWLIRDLAARVSRAVATSQGGLVVRDGLMAARSRRPPTSAPSV